MVRGRWRWCCRNGTPVPCRCAWEAAETPVAGWRHLGDPFSPLSMELELARGGGSCGSPRMGSVEVLCLLPVPREPSQLCLHSEVSIAGRPSFLLLLVADVSAPPAFQILTCSRHQHRQLVVGKCKNTYIRKKCGKHWVLWATAWVSLAVVGKRVGPAGWARMLRSQRFGSLCISAEVLYFLLFSVFFS